MLVLALIALWRPIFPNKSMFDLSGLLDRRPAVSAFVLAAVCAAFFWLLRSRQILLGDAHPLINDLPTGQFFHPRQPGTMWLQQFLYQHLGGWFRADGIPESDIARDVVALGSVVAGFVFVLVVVALARSLTKDHTRGASWVAAGILLAQGYALLFFGYIENYTFYALIIGVYLLTALMYLRGGLTLQIVCLVFLGGLLLHLSSIALLPSLVFLMIRGLRRVNTRLDALTAIGVFVVGLFAVDWCLRAMSPNFGLWVGLEGIIETARSSQMGGAGPEYWLSALHLRDFLNEHFLIGPLSAFLFVPAFVFALREKNKPTAPVVFLSLAAWCFLAGSFATSEPLLGYARDWDLFAPAGVCYTAVGLYFFFQHTRNTARASKILMFGLVFSMLQLLPWVWINHSERLSLERFKTLPLGWGRTEVVVANWYLQRNRYDESLEWLQKALQVYPRNANAYNLMASIYLDKGDYERAREAYVRAVALRPDKIGFRNNYAYVLMQMGRFEEALPQLRWLVDRVPHELVHWRSLRDALTALGRQDELAQVNERLLELYESLLAQQPNDIDLVIMTGTIFGDMGRNDHAVERFRRALTIDPTSAAALFNMATALGAMGRGAEARPYLQKFIELYPDHAMAPRAREHLDTISK
jgi:tetratricopeptide (TPR) repeat protein